MSEEITIHENNVPASSDFMFDMQKFEMCDRFAQIMASGKCTMPDHLRNSPGDCFAVISQAVMWRMNPFAVAQKTHIISGKLGYEAQLVNAVINSLAPTRDKIKYEWFGPWDRVIGKFKTMTGQSGKSYQAPDWKPSDELGCGVKVWATLKGEDEPRVLELLLQQATVRNSTLWASDPKQQLAYLAVKRWSRLYCPEVILGVYTPDELEEQEIKNITPPAEDKSKKSATEKLASKIGAVKNAKETIEASAVEVEPKISELVTAEIERTHAPITLDDVKKHLIDCKIIVSDIDDENQYTPENLAATKAHIALLVKRVAEATMKLES